VLIIVATPPRYPDRYVRCGVRPMANRIIGGVEVTPHSWPWQCSVQFRSGSRRPFHICGCSIIDRRWVVTAAHCLYVLCLLQLSLSFSLSLSSSSSSVGSLLQEDGCFHNTMQARTCLSKQQNTNVLSSEVSLNRP